ncbi:MAG: hypothetical protein R2852_05450 [Bacteroidia bacterium]
MENICSDDERLETKRARQAYYDKQYHVKITPNPFKEQFEMQTSFEGWQFFIGEEPQIITFYDDQGNVLKTNTIRPDEVHSYSFPDVPAGKTIFYRITWEEFVISGQILKTN